MSQKLGGGGRKHDQLPEKAESPTKKTPCISQGASLIASSKFLVHSAGAVR